MHAHTHTHKINVDFCSRSMLPDAIDEAAARDGVRRESLFYAFFVFWQKFSTGIALALSTLALQV